MVLFNETQKFRQWWIWVLMVVIVVLEAKLIYHRFELGRPEILKVVLYSFVHLFVILILVYSNLTTEITEKGVTYKFFPFNFRQKMIMWDEVDKVYVREYNPIFEYGGWGYRMGVFGKGRALNVSGNVGLQLELKSGKRLLIGTKKKEELNQVIMDLGKKLKRPEFSNQF